MSYFSIFLKIPESITLSVRFWSIFIFLSSTFSAILFAFPFNCPKSYSNFLYLAYSPLKLSKLLLSLKEASSIFPLSMIFLRCDMMVSSSAFINTGFTFLCFSFYSFLASIVAFCLRVSIFSAIESCTDASISDYLLWISRIIRFPSSGWKDCSRLILVSTAISSRTTIGSFRNHYYRTFN